MCEDREADYKIAFKHFAERDLNVKFESSPPRSNRYILLIKGKDRIPEEVKRVAQKFIRKGDTLLYLKKQNKEQTITCKITIYKSVIRIFKPLQFINYFIKLLFIYQYTTVKKIYFA